MREEGGRGRGFDHNVGRKGSWVQLSQKQFSFVTKLISKKEITLTDMAGVRGFISMTIAYYQHSQV